MNRKKLFFLVCLGLLVIGFSWPAFACEFGQRAKITVKAPLDAVNCEATPPTITVLGLNIDISKANLEGDGELTCSNLAPGQVVKVELASDNPVPSTKLLLASAIEVEEGGDHNCNVGGVIIAAPIQAINGTNVTVLGLAVDVSQAVILNNDDDGPLNISQLAPGQFAFLMLPSNQAPLSAAWMWVHQVQIKVMAPLDAVNCGANPPTITVLGLNIDISGATLYNGDENPITCGDLTVGQMVKVTLAGDIPNSNTNLFTATEVETARSDSSFAGIFAPLQAIDPNGTNVTVLGLVIDITNASPKGDDDGPISLNQWAVGQFAMVFLSSNQPPLSATFLWVHKVEIKVQGPLDAVNCEATPPTITVLGLNIDISKTNLEGDGHNLTCGGGTLSCADLKVGQVVRVTLASDIPDPTTNLLSATKIETEEGAWYGWDDDNISSVKIAAPIQAINGTNVTVLGLVIDISDAILELDNGLPMNASQLAVGQFVKLTLASNTPPLSAIILVAQASSVQATIHVTDEKGNPVDDGAVKDVQADVTVGQGKKARKFHFVGSGTLYLSGLPTGKAKIVVTRVHNGQKSTGSKSFTVKANATQHLLIRLKPVRR